MLKHELAQELRDRQHQLKLVEKAMVEALTDDQVIDCCVICSDCGQKQIADQQLPNLIATAKDAEDSFLLCDRLGISHP